MAIRGGYFCALCEKRYDFRSRFDRHMASLGHQMLEKTYKASQEKQSTEDTGTINDIGVSICDSECEASFTLHSNAMDVSCKHLCSKLV